MNNSIFFSLYNLAHHSVVFDKIAVFITDPFIYIMLVVISIYFIFDVKDLNRKFNFSFILEKVKSFVPLFITGLFAWIVGDLIKILFKVNRPFVVFSQVEALVSESGFSFPSLHATLIAAFAFAVYFKNKKFGYICLFAAFLIGISRVVVGVHFPVDVLGGFTLGFAVAFIVKTLARKLNNSSI